MSGISSFQNQQAEHLPVILLLDTSWSMNGEKIDELNKAVEEMLEELRKSNTPNRKIDVAVITFGCNGAKLHLDLTCVNDIAKSPFFKADGMTPMGEALKIAKSMIEDRNKIPSHYYRPLVVLLSDGMPTDDWEGIMHEFISEGRSSKTQRISMGIGGGELEKPLKMFSGEKKCFTNNEAKYIREFFSFIVMTVTVRSNSMDPDVIEDEDVDINEAISGNEYKDDDSSDDDYPL